MYHSQVSWKVRFFQYLCYRLMALVPLTLQIHQMWHLNKSGFLCCVDLALEEHWSSPGCASQTSYINAFNLYSTSFKLIQASVKRCHFGIKFNDNINVILLVCRSGSAATVEWVSVQAERGGVLYAAPIVSLYPVSLICFMAWPL